jgi:hypothetical protein
LQPIVVARFCPVLFERNDGHHGQQQQPQQQRQEAGGDQGAAACGAPAPHPVDLPYKMVFAVRRRTANYWLENYAHART